MRKAIAAAFGLVLVAGAAMASNTGFKLNYQLTWAGAAFTNNNWVSVPFFYYPSGVITTGAQNAIDLCTDLNGAPGNTSKVIRIFRYETSNDTAPFKSCASTTIKGFDLKVGEGYSFIPAAGNPTVTVDIVGSHDDTYAGNKGGTTTYTLLNAGAAFTNNNWISVPYHVKADNAIDLCTTLNGGVPGSTSKVVRIFRYETSNDTAPFKSCASTTIKGFDLKPGEGYSAIPAASGPTQAIQYDVY